MKKKIETCSKEIEDIKKKQMNLWDYNKSSNIHIIRIPDGEEKEGKAEKALKDIMAENFPKLAKDINLHIQET